MMLKSFKITFLLLVVYLHKVVNETNTSSQSNGICTTKRIYPNSQMKGGIEIKIEKVCCRGYTIVQRKCKPLCNKVCENGYCSAPNTCTCNPGYKRFNQFRCIPECHNCDHGFCSAPNVCHCYPGYEKEGELGNCVPKCELPCVNGICVRPNECRCFNGYKASKVLMFYCEPTCKKCPKNSICTKPDQCECEDGYKLNEEEFECLPYCINCEFGNCVAPNDCRCREGYEKNSNDVCKPKCSIPCKNGFCSVPNKCTCNPGYEENPHGNECIPICDKGCKNGFCTEPNVCTCFPDYINNDEGQCVPLCSQPCKNGFCSSYEHCDCFLHYEKITNYVCQPICEKKCINGNCSAPEKCTCLQNYREVNSTYCEPECTKCLNGFCASPGFCECHKGFIHYTEDNSVCINASCIDCGHGECSEDKARCLCWDEAIWDPLTRKCTNKYLTTAYDNSVENIVLKESSTINYETSSDTNEDISNEYVTMLTNTDDYMDSGEGYHPKYFEWCDRNCVNGTCVDGIQCLCAEGYHYNGTQCEPVCENGCGKNGYCIEPDICDCENGYVPAYDNDKVSNHCVPLCNGEEDGCINGTCVAPEECRCFEDYVMSSTSKFICTFPEELKESLERFSIGLWIWIFPLCLILVAVLLLKGKKGKKVDYNIEIKELEFGVRNKDVSNENENL